MIQARWAEGAAERYPGLLKELNQHKVDVIVIGAAAGAIAGKSPESRFLLYLPR